jgi:hypothetical protein
MNCVLTKDIAHVIGECFATDTNLIASYHIQTGDLNQAVERTCSDLSHADKSFQFYQITEGGTTIGFFGKEHSNYLTTIFVHPDYRNKETLTKVWKLIQSKFDEDFFTAVYAKNTPAIRFFTRNGTQIDKFNTDSGPSIAFKFLKEI